MPNPNQFTLVASPKPTARRTSSLFKFLSEIKLEQLNPKQQFDLKEKGVIKISKVLSTTEARGSFYILDLALNKAPALKAYVAKGYKLKENHVRVDEVFGTAESVLAQQQLCSHWHLTQYYTNAKGDLVTVHAYYHYGALISLYIRFNQEKNQQITRSDFMNEMRQNSSEALGIVNGLLDRLSKHREKVSADFEIMLARFKDINYIAQLSKETLRQQLEHGAKLNAKLNDLIEDYTDQRFSLIEASIAHALRTNAKSPIIAEELADVVTEQNVAVTTSPVVSSKPKAKINYLEDVNALQKRLNELAQKYVKATTKDLISLEPVKTVLSDDILCFSLSKNSKPFEKEMAKIHTKLNSLPVIGDILTKAAMAGELEKVKTLYEHGRHSLTISFFMDLFSYLGKNRLTIDKVGNYVALCELFYERSDNYRLVVSLTPFILFSINELGLKESLAAQLSMNNEQLLRLLLRQTNCAHSIGIVVGREACSLINYVAGMNATASKIQLLLEHGAKIDGLPFALNQAELLFKPIHEVLGIRNEIARPNSASPVGIDPETASLLNYYNTFVPVKSTLYAYCSNDDPNVDIINRLINETSNFNLMLTLANLYYSGRCIIGFGNEPQVYKAFACNEERMAMLQHDSKALESTKYLGSYLYFYMLPHAAKFVFLTQVAQAVQLRIAALNDAQIEEILDKVLVFADKQFKQANYQIATISYSAAIFLVNHKTPSLKTHEKLIEMFKQLKTVFSADNNSTLFREGKISLHIAGIEQSITNLRALSAFLPKPEVQPIATEYLAAKCTYKPGS